MREVPLLFVCAAAESDGHGAPEWLILLTSATFPGHDPAQWACQCEDPRKPWPRCPAHGARAGAYAWSGRPLGTWAR